MTMRDDPRTFHLEWIHDGWIIVDDDGERMSALLNSYPDGLKQLSLMISNYLQKQP